VQSEWSSPMDLPVGVDGTDSCRMDTRFNFRQGTRGGARNCEIDRRFAGFVELNE